MRATWGFSDTAIGSSSPTTSALHDEKRNSPKGLGSDGALHDSEVAVLPETFEHLQQPRDVVAPHGRGRGGWGNRCSLIRGHRGKSLGPAPFNARRASWMKSSSMLIPTRSAR